MLCIGCTACAKEEKANKTEEKKTVTEEVQTELENGELPPIPEEEYVDEIPDAPYTLTVYPGADADFTLYEDSGDGYAYENGEYAEVALHWENATRTLHIGERKGAFPTMVATRTLVLRVVGEREMTVTYTGQGMTIAL
jgi:alpha-D-xyloside xylohydrolase